MRARGRICTFEAWRSAGSSCLGRSKFNLGPEASFTHMNHFLLKNYSPLTPILGHHHLVAVFSDYIRQQANALCPADWDERPHAPPRGSSAVVGSAALGDRRFGCQPPGSGQPRQLRARCLIGEGKRETVISGSRRCGLVSLSEKKVKSYLIAVASFFCAMMTSGMLRRLDDDGTLPVDSASRRILRCWW